MSSVAFIEQIRHYIRLGEIDRAIDEALPFLREHDSNYYHKILVQAGRYENFKQQRSPFREDTHPYLDGEEVIYSLLEILAQIEESHYADEHSAWQSARAQHSTAAYTDFLRRYPESEHRQKAGEQLKEVRYTELDTPKGKGCLLSLIFLAGILSAVIS